MTEHAPDPAAAAPTASVMARTPSAFDATARPLAPCPMEARTPYRIRSAETWDLVRTHYLRGESARALSERYGVSVSNIRRRAGDEGWTRRGHAEAVDHFRLDGPPQTAHAGSAPTAAAPAGGFADPYPGAPEAEALDVEDCTHPKAVARLALAATSRALRAGRFAEAERLGKLAETLLKVAGPSRGGIAGHGELEDALLALNDKDRLDRVNNRIEAGMDALIADLEEAADLTELMKPPSQRTGRMAATPGSRAEVEDEPELEPQQP